MKRALGSPELVLVKAAHRLLALTSDDEETLYTSTGTDAPAYVLFRARLVLVVVVVELVLLLVPLLVKSAERALRKSLEKAPPVAVCPVMMRYCSEHNMARTSTDARRTSVCGMLYTADNRRRTMCGVIDGMINTRPGDSASCCGWQSKSRRNQGSNSPRLRGSGRQAPKRQKLA